MYEGNLIKTGIEFIIIGSGYLLMTIYQSALVIVGPAASCDLLIVQLGRSLVRGKMIALFKGMCIIKTATKFCMK
jgi:hypothetical protein